MKHLVIIASIFLISTTCLAQNDNYVISQKRSVQLMPVYQSWTNNGTSSFNEFTIPVQAYLPINRYVSMNLRSNQAVASGDVPEKISGITDTQLSINYFFESLNLVTSLGLNLPSGKNELSTNEFITSAMLSSNYFNFKVPNFGQGFNLAPGVTWAYPLKENLVLGLGTTIQLKGKFKPIEGMPIAYNPGNEILFTGGVDFSFDKLTSFTADLIYITYGADKVGANEVYSAGDMILTNLRFKKYFGFNELQLLINYKIRTKNQVAYVPGILTEENKKTMPNQLSIIGLYRYRVNQQIYTTFMIERRSFEKTTIYPGASIFALGARPEIRLSSQYSVPVILKFSFGAFDTNTSISGFEIGCGVNYSF